MLQLRKVPFLDEMSTALRMRFFHDAQESAVKGKGDLAFRLSGPPGAVSSSAKQLCGIASGSKHDQHASWRATAPIAFGIVSAIYQPPVGSIAKCKLTDPASTRTSNHTRTHAHTHSAPPPPPHTQTNTHIHTNPRSPGECFRMTEQSIIAQKASGRPTTEPLNVRGRLSVTT